MFSIFRFPMNCASCAWDHVPSEYKPGVAAAGALLTGLVAGTTYSLMTAPDVDTMRAGVLNNHYNTLAVISYTQGGRNAINDAVGFAPTSSDTSGDITRIFSEQLVPLVGSKLAFNALNEFADLFSDAAKKLVEDYFCSAYERDRDTDDVAANVQQEEVPQESTDIPPDLSNAPSHQDTQDATTETTSASATQTPDNNDETQEASGWWTILLQILEIAAEY